MNNTDPHCTCRHFSDGSVYQDSCPLHARRDPCAVTAQITGRRRKGTIRRGVCTNCGHDRRKTAQLAKEEAKAAEAEAEAETKAAAEAQAEAEAAEDQLPYDWDSEEAQGTKEELEAEALEEAKRASDILAERSEALSQRMELAKRNAGAADMRSRLFLEIAQTYRLAAAPEDMDRYAKEAAAAKEAHEAAALERTRLEELADALERRQAEAAHESYAAAQRVEQLLMIARSSSTRPTCTTAPTLVQ